MQWRVTLAVAVMCVGCICHRVGAEARSRVMVPRDYGVKLCGREFIRAVIFTCGGSRWKRSTNGDLDPLDWSSLSEETAEDDPQTWQQLSDSRSPLPALPSYSLTDLLSLFRSTGDREQPPLRRHAASEEERGNEQRLTSKKKRNFSLGVAGMCCNQGCTKNDIGRLC
uniref:Relaxin 1 n=1 Tax=Oryzias latipes TaxID=8090 RepID=A0A3P9KVI5_ORYLA